MAENVTINLKANDQATVNIEKVFKNMKALTKSVNDLAPKQQAAARGADEAANSFDKFAESVKKLAIGYLGLATARKAVDFLREAVVASTEQEAIFSRLGASITGVGGDWSKLRGEVEAFADAQQRTTRFGDTETAQALQRLVTLTGTYRGALDGVRLAQDFAEGSGRSLNEATNLVGKALTGNLEALGEVIPQARILARTMGEGATLSDKAAAATRLLTESYGGMAKNVGAGTVELARIKNAIGDVTEAIGDAIRKTSIYRSTFGTLADVVEDTAKLIAGEKLGGSLDFAQDKGINADIAKFADNLRMTGNAAAASTTMQRKMADALKALHAEQRAFDATLKEGQLRVVAADEMNRQDRIDDLTFKLNLYAQAQARVNDELAEQSRINATPKREDDLSWADSAGVTGNTALNTALGRLQQKAAAAAVLDERNRLDRLADIRSLADDNRLVAAQRVSDRLLAIDVARDEEVLRLEDERLQASLAMTQQIEAAIQNVAIRAIEGLGAAFGRFVVTGKFNAKQFGLGMMGAIGEMSVAMGTFFLTTGIALQALASGPLGAGAAIAAGAALIAFGGALSAAASALGGKKGGRSSTPIPSDFTTANPGQAQQPERVLRVEVNSSGTNDADDVLAEMFRIGMNRARESGGIGLVPA